MTVIFSKPTEQDKIDMSTVFSADVLEGRTKAEFTDDEGHTAVLFIDSETMNRLGQEYIKNNTTLYYSAFCEEWCAKLSQNAYYNDPQRNPYKIIRVSFDGLEGGTGREIYKGIDTGRYYLRENYSPREDFARWYVCGKRRRTDDGDEPRANIIFEYNGKQERVTYDDYNGVAAYSNTFNKDFNTEV